MLASILPGLRDLRSPLAAGYAWMLVGWLGLGQRIPTRAEAEGTILSLYQVADILNGVILLALLSFVSYLIGSLSRAVFSGLGDVSVGPLNRWLRGVVYRGPLTGRVYSGLFRMSSARALGAISLKRQWSLELLVNKGIRRADLELRRAGTSLRDHPDYERARRRSGLHGLPDDAPLTVRQLDELRERLGHPKGLPGTIYRTYGTEVTVSRGLLAYLGALIADEMKNELNLLATRLIGKEPGLFSQYDRLRAESEFRLAVAPPIAALVGVVGMKDSQVWLLALVAVGLLRWQARRMEREANDLLVDAVVAGTIEAPSLGDLAAFVAEKVDAVGEKVDAAKDRQRADVAPSPQAEPQ